MLLDESSKGFEPEGAWKPAGGRFQGEAACPAGQVESHRLRQIRTAILIQSVSRLRFLFCLTTPYSEERREAAWQFARENNTADRLK